MQWQALLAVAILAGPRPLCSPKIPRGPVAVEVAQQPAALRLQEDSTAPNVYFQAVIDAGSAHDPVGKEGLAHLVARSLVEAGTEAMTPDEVAQTLYPLGTSFDVVVAREFVSVRLTCHRDVASECAAQFTDALVRPRFDEDTVARLVDEAVYAVTDGLTSDEEALGREVLDAWLFEGHPYGHPAQGRSGVLPLLTAEDARAFHAEHYVRSSVTVGLAGAVSEEVQSSVRTALEALPTSLPSRLVLQRPVEVSGRSLLAVRTSTPVTGVWMGHEHTVDRTHDDWPALYLAAMAFGAHRQSHGRLFRAIRGERGLNYGDYAYMESFRQRGWSTMPEQGVLRSQPHFAIWIRPTSSDNGAFAVKLAIKELEELVANGLTDEEFEATRSYLIGRMALEAPTPGHRLAYHLDGDVTQGVDLLDDLEPRLLALTVLDVNQALLDHLRPDDLKIVAVTGDPEGLVAALTEDSPTPIVYADVTPSEAQAARDSEVASMVLGIPAERARIVDAEGRFR